MLPKIEEQIQISSFFKNLDQLITIHQRRLEHLKKLKTCPSLKTRPYI
ncbi:MAG: hypothetical protein LBC17_00770 [Lactobacillaceae bacterium]|nr:hypothetical protein [Lactobacillaceae bacterium]